MLIASHPDNSTWTTNTQQPSGHKVPSFLIPGILEISGNKASLDNEWQRWNCYLSWQRDTDYHTLGTRIPRDKMGGLDPAPLLRLRADESTSNINVLDVKQDRHQMLIVSLTCAIKSYLFHRDINITSLRLPT
ncbi:hypothetical protein PoB_006058700 [Plakobranchus ocellatus]|uniref:Uncharacterized protein n=1 Tax=Plakobranchus ocellatus TaxID=259542 RepID=A0AAV4CQB8_9GAST|nr:hypothetical protein PoB_006058700 [Plakobranchus ocellatus]